MRKRNTHEDLHKELWKDWRFRFWYRVYGPYFFIEDLLIRYRIWKRNRK